MKKLFIVCVITALCLFVGASPWEGAAAAAPEGELPVSGRYIATNSFPRNTVVDIVNIETNKSTRVIVASNLDSPGLLAIVSREAAELIGMRPGSVSRIRMTQPSDPVAYVRFTEGLSSGIADYDSGNVITEENYNEEAFNPAAAQNRADDYTMAYNTYPPAPADTAPANTAPVGTAASSASSDTGRPSYVLEPEWSGSRSARDIVDLPVYTAQEEKPEEPIQYFVDEPEEIAKAEMPEGEAVPEKTPEYIPEDDYAEIAEYFPEPEDEFFEDDFFEEPQKMAESAEVFDDYEYDYLAEPEYDFYEEPPAKLAEYNIVPTEERPPIDIYGIDPAFIIPGITRASERASEPETAKTSRIDIDTDFSIPRKSELTRGSYYVQLASFDTVESVESSISRIPQDYKQAYEPFVYRDNGREYRVLLRAMNQGESYAVLQRFKSIGYKDAFVRLAR